MGKICGKAGLLGRKNEDSLYEGTKWQTCCYLSRNTGGEGIIKVDENEVFSPILRYVSVLDIMYHSYGSLLLGLSHLHFFYAYLRIIPFSGYAKFWFFVSLREGGSSVKWVLLLFFIIAIHQFKDRKITFYWSGNFSCCPCKLVGLFFYSGYFLHTFSFCVDSPPEPLLSHAQSYRR